MTTRLWFRLDEIVPIAEHAMACPHHRMTPAQLAAGHRQWAGLSWQHTAEGHDILSSNGVPVWYDDDQQVHTARAWTWLHTPTGHRGSSGLWNQADPRDWFLPLQRRYPDHRYPLITVLRKGAQQGGHWFVLDTDQRLTNGRHRFQVRDHRWEVVPADATWLPATVTAAAVAHGEYPALIAEGYSVEGEDVLACFTRRTVEAMIADLGVVNTDAMPGEFPVLRLDGDVLLVLWEHDDGTAITPRLVEADRVHPGPDGTYAVGAYLWPWKPVT